MNVMQIEMNANPADLIDWFDDFYGPNKYSFLSNFYLAPVAWSDRLFITSEAAFAWSKVDPNHPDAEEWRDAIQNAPDPGAAKLLGRRCPLRPEWEQIKYGVMRGIVWEKFQQNPHLADALDATGDAWLIEGTFWNDRCWGVDRTSAASTWDCVGENWLGHILMWTRQKQREQSRA